MTTLTRALITLVLVLGLSPELFAQATPRPPRKGRKVAVKIDSSPQGGMIFLDDKQYGVVGYTPWSGKLVKGDYKLIVELQGYKPYERLIRVDRESKDFFTPLEKQVIPGVVDIQAAADPNVFGAQVYVDGQLAEGTAPTLVNVPEGRHLVEVKKTGFQDYSQWVSLQQGQKQSIAPVLRPLVVETPKGSILVDADVPDAEVSVDGKLAPDTTPTVVENLDEGVHVIEVRKAPAMPWKQTVTVKGGQRTKAFAQLSSTVQVGGTIRVLSNAAEAEVWLDGTQKGVAPIDLTGIATGPHIVEVKAKGHAPREEKVTINNGQSVILKLDLVPEGMASSSQVGRVKIVSPVPEARVFIDGASVGTVPVEKDLPAGEHFVVVEQQGYAKFEQKVSVEAGRELPITAELLAVGTLRFLSNLEGAEVVVDGIPVGKTPMVREDVEVGDHVVRIRKEGFHAFEQTVRVEGGKLGIVNADLRRIETGPTPEQVATVKRGLSSFGARTMPMGRFSTDVGVGYPYFLEGRATVGVMDARALGWDVGVGFRSLLTTWEILGHTRVRVFERHPFSFGAFGTIGGGGGFNGRNAFTLQAGAMATINFNNIVNATGRAYVDVWSDRLCADVGERMNDTDGDGIPDDGPRACTKDATQVDLSRASELLGKTVNNAKDLQDRDSGARLYLSGVVEAAVMEKISLYFMIEGAPFQSERPSHSNLFNQPMLERDIIYNFKAGVTAKF
ncbi:MAG: PEGA domain-containing protein [Deltaproteobacteria bacterium]|nr:PEGA domain-containing protein [Deltaproteobacteria bacterium]